MILHTIMPMGLILNNNILDDVKYKEVDYKGEKVEVTQYNNKVVISRLYSTDPKKYLDPEFELGKVIKNSELN
ncbi:MAG: YlzJ-like family protein [Clostridiales bacterium]|nr:YlzJ-like family protein [Clostridiales bacterium]